MTFREHFTRVPDGLTLYSRIYDAEGGERGLPVICLHGLTRNSRDFDDVAPAIAARGRRVIVSDMRGRDHSDRDPDPVRYHNATYADDVRHILDDVGVHKAVFVGTSMGGVITMLLEGTAPERIAAAVLNDIGPLLNPMGIARISGYVGQATTTFPSWAKLIDALRTVQGSQYPGADSAFWNKFARRCGRELPGGTVERDYDPMIGWALANARAILPDLRPLFATLGKKPLLVVHGVLSDLLTPLELAVMRELAPDFTLVDIPGVGHAPTLDEPDSRTALWAFLDSVP